MPADKNTDAKLPILGVCMKVLSKECTYAISYVLCVKTFCIFVSSTRNFWINFNSHLKRYFIGTLQSKNMTGHYYNQKISNEISFTLVKCRLHEFKKAATAVKSSKQNYCNLVYVFHQIERRVSDYET